MHLMLYPHQISSIYTKHRNPKPLTTIVNRSTGPYSMNTKKINMGASLAWPTIALTSSNNRRRKKLQCNLTGIPAIHEPRETAEGKAMVVLSDVCCCCLFAGLVHLHRLVGLWLGALVLVSLGAKEKFGVVHR